MFNSDGRTGVLAARGGACDPDSAVEDSLEFLRYWVDFAFPRYLMAVSRIQANVFGRIGLRSGDYGVFASRVENHFAPPGIAALDEHGNPSTTHRSGPGLRSPAR
jgi:hypothetical protein